MGSIHREMRNPPTLKQHVLEAFRPLRIYLEKGQDKERNFKLQEVAY